MPSAKAETSRFARAMSTLVGNTVPLVQALNISAGILNNRRMANSLKDVAQGVKRGKASRSRWRAPNVSAARVAPADSRRGNRQLDLMFARMAQIYEEETRAAIRRFTSIFEPLVILIMGIIVGALVLSMLIAITSINDVAI